MGDAAHAAARDHVNFRCFSGGCANELQCTVGGQ